MYTSETWEDGIKSGSRPAEKNNHKKHTFEYVKNQFLGRTKGGALLKRKKKKKRKRDERGRKTKKKKRKRDERCWKRKVKKRKPPRRKKKKRKAAGRGEKTKIRNRKIDESERKTKTAGPVKYNRKWRCDFANVDTSHAKRLQQQKTRFAPHDFRREGSKKGKENN